MRGLACEILGLMAKPLRVRPSVFATLLTDHESDSLFRLNHCPSVTDGPSSSSFHHGNTPIRFGEHSDPQILTLLTSNGVPGLQISLGNDVWVPVNSNRQAFCVTVGDLLQSYSNEFKPDGAGRGNWGTQSDEITQETEEVVVVEGDKTEKPLTEEETPNEKKENEAEGQIHQ